ncbi:MAG: Gfo/Idh/MocA family oxidoreductase [Bacteroidota bacterium]
MLRIGVLGAGHLGKIHLKCIQQIEAYELVGFYDPDEQQAEAASTDFGLPAFPSAEALIEAVDVVDIVSPTVTHYELARAALLAGRHLFIEKPLTHTLDEARALANLARDKALKVQVGHVERFNPAVLALEGIPLQPMFIEAHRLAAFNPRGTDVSVILDLMIHDLDIILSMLDTEVRYISASGVAVVSDTPDIANARLEFANGCVANLTASRISMKQMRKLRLFQRDAYISLDFLNKTTQVIRLFDQDAPDLPAEDLMTLETNNGRKHIHLEMQEGKAVNAIKMELELLAQSIKEDRPTAVPLEEGLRVLELAYQIIEEMDRRLSGLDVE